MAAGSPFILPPDVNSASYSQGAFSSLLNPTFSDEPGGSNLAYRFLAYDGDSNASHMFLARILGLSFTYAWYDKLLVEETSSLEDANASYFNINKGFFFNNTFGLGMGYSFSKSGNSDFDNYSSWSFGFLFRPIEYLSIGIALNDLWGKISGEEIARKEVYSISIRPLTDRATLSVDAIRLSGQKFKDMEYEFSADIRIIRDISLFYKTDLDLNMKFGVTLPLFFQGSTSSTMLLDYYRSSNTSNHPDYNSFAISLPLVQYKDAVRFARGDNMIRIKLGRDINEIETESFFRKRSITFLDIISGIKSAGEDDTINGIILYIDHAGLGFAQIQELRGELIKFKKTGKKVYSIMSSPGNREFYLASISDKIYYTPNSTFNLSGLSAQVYFFKGLMDKVGVKFESVKKGAYKSANESMTREHMSDEARANLASIVSDLNDQYINDISSSRNISRERIELIFKKGIMTPEEARENGFIDKVYYEDEALKDISKSLTVIKLNRYISEKKKKYTWAGDKSIAVIHVNGSIISGKSGASSFTNSIGSTTYRTMLEEAFSDYSVKAIVIRINSGGGSAAASDYMLNDLMKLKKKTNKPVVFSFGNVAASGGYYIACTGDKIFASNGTITGSIGVISGKVTLKGLYEKLGINKDIIKMSKYADIYSESKELSQEERKVLQKGVDFIYDRFTGKVMQARNINKDKISDTAEGRVFTGNQAKVKKLINEKGSIITAIEYARKLAEIDDDYTIKSYPDQNIFLKEMLESDDAKVLTGYIKTLIKNVDLVNYRDERELYMLPYTIEIK